MNILKNLPRYHIFYEAKNVRLTAHYWDNGSKHEIVLQFLKLPTDGEYAWRYIFNFKQRLTSRCGHCVWREAHKRAKALLESIGVHEIKEVEL